MIDGHEGARSDDGHVRRRWGTAGPEIVVTAKALPSYRAMLAVDVKDFSAREGRRHHELTARIPELLGAAFDRAGIGQEWARGRRFPRSDGDGYVAGFRPRVLPFLLNPFLHALEAELTTSDSDARWDPPVRMRVSINVGPVTDTGSNGIADGSGTARIELHRLLNAEPVRRLLERSGPGTHVAAIVSRHAYEDAVLTGYSGDGEQYYVPEPVAEKTFRGRAYLRVPNPTGDLLANGFRPGGDTPQADPGTTRTAPRVSNVIGTSYGPLHTGHGDIRRGDDDRPTR